MSFTQENTWQCVCNKCGFKWEITSGIEPEKCPTCFSKLWNKTIPEEWIYCEGHHRLRGHRGNDLWERRIER